MDGREIGSAPDAEVKIGELMAKVPKATKDNARKQIDSGVDLIKPKAEVIREAGFTPKQVEWFRTSGNRPNTAGAESFILAFWLIGRNYHWMTKNGNMSL